MFNLNDPKLTKQQKEFLLALQTDKELKEEVEKEKLKGNNICFPSYWLLKIKDLIEFNKAAHQIDTCFDFEKDGLDYIYPEWHNICFEGERVEIGEWDETYKRWSSHSYQRLGVIFVNGIFGGFKDGHMLIGTYEPEKEHKDHMEFKYPLSFGKEKVKGNTFGMIDIPLHLLNDYEEERVYERNYFIGKTYEETKSKYLQQKLDYEAGKTATKTKIKQFRKSNRKKKDFKSFGGGFGK